MKSACNAISNDNEFYLGHLPTLNRLLKIGLTTFVEKTFPNYSDMTLVQFSIASRKPKTLNLMLERLLSFDEIDYNDIMYPKTSNTRGSLLNLAIEFGSKGYYDTIDNSCFNIIVENFKDKIIHDKKCIESSLKLAIRNKNNEVVKTLIGVNANLFYPLEEKDKTINDRSILIDMPIMIIFKLHNNMEQLKTIFIDLFGKGEQCRKILKRLIDIKVENNYLSFILQEMKLDQARNFILEAKKRKDPIQIFDNEDCAKEDKHEEKEEEEEETEDPGIEKSKIRKCCECDETDSISRCVTCNKYFCSTCIGKHYH